MTYSLYAVRSLFEGTAVMKRRAEITDDDDDGDDDGLDSFAAVGRVIV